jgi:Tol biopolymer transport system component
MQYFLLIASGFCPSQIGPAATEKEVILLQGHRAVIYSLAFSPEGKRIATGSDDGTVRIWHSTTGKELHRFSTAGSGVCAVAFSPNGKILAYSAFDGVIRLADSETGKELYRLSGQERYAKCLVFDPHGRLLASGGEDGTICLWSIDSGKRFTRWNTHTDWINCLAFSPDGKMLVSGGHDGTLAISRTDTGKRIRLNQTKAQVDSIALTPDGRSIAVASYYNPDIELWEVASSKIRSRLKAQKAKGLLSVAYSPDGTTLVAGGGGKVIHFWDLGSVNVVHNLEAHSGIVRSLAFSSNGKLVASASSDGKARIWSVKNVINRNRPVEAPATDEELEKLWTDLAGQDAESAYRAYRRLAAVPEQAVAFMKPRLKPVRDLDVDKKRIDQLVRDLDNDEYKVRSAAKTELQKIGEQAAPTIRGHLKGQLSVEVRRKLQEMLDELDQRGITQPEMIRSLRSIEILELVGTEDARRLLNTLAQGVQEALLTEQAVDSLERLTKRGVKP